MTRNLKSVHERTTMTVKRKTLASFQILRLMCGLDLIEIMEQISDGLDPILSHYYKTVFVDKQRLNLDIKRVGSSIHISLIPKLSVHETPRKPVMARFNRKGEFKGIVKNE